MSSHERIGNLDPTQISVDDSGRLVIDNPILSEAIRKQLASGRGAAEVAARQSGGVNIIACGNNCATTGGEELE